MWLNWLTFGDLCEPRELLRWAVSVEPVHPLSRLKLRICRDHSGRLPELVDVTGGITSIWLFHRPEVALSTVPVPSQAVTSLTSNNHFSVSAQGHITIAEHFHGGRLVGVFIVVQVVGRSSDEGAMVRIDPGILASAKEEKS